MGGGAALRLLSDIRFGTERYPEKVARRLRTVNFGTRIAAAFHGFFVVVSLFYVAQFWWLLLAHIVAMLFFAGVPLLHRLNSQAGAVATLVLFYLEIITYICLIGTGAGIQFYFLLGVALTVMYLGAQHIVITTASGVMAAALIVILQLTVPDDTGLLPRSLIVTALVSNAVVACGSLLLLASYALSEIARAETAAEREYERSNGCSPTYCPAPSPRD